MAQLKDLLVNGKSKFLDMVTAVGVRLATGGSNTAFWNTNGGTNTASEIVSSSGLLGNYLPLVGGTMSGTIKRAYNDDSDATPFTQIVAEGINVSILRIGYEDFDQMSADYGFTLQYAGFNLGVNNRLRLYADNQTGSQVTAISINQAGQVGVGVDSDINYRMKVSGTSRFEGTVNVTNAAANNGCVMSYDSTEECMKFTFN